LLQTLFHHALEAGTNALQALLLPVPFFVVVAFFVKGRQLAKDIMRAANEARTNILFHFTNALLVAPILAVAAVTIKSLVHETGIDTLTELFWGGLPSPVIGFAGVFLLDFIGYWRHRIEHLPLLWPSHAVHHSDTEMTWLAIFRFHPINRFTTFSLDMAFLFVLGLPAYAVLVGITVKHFYGAFIHADLPWTFGPLKYVLVSPAMHRWHHARDRAAYNTNYATVFALFDIAFGTFRVPGVCEVSLGVPELMGRGFIGQMVHPLKPSSYSVLFSRWIGRQDGVLVDLGGAEEGNVSAQMSRLYDQPSS